MLYIRRQNALHGNCYALESVDSPHVKLECYGKEAPSSKKRQLNIASDSAERKTPHYWQNEKNLATRPLNVDLTLAKAMRGGQQVFATEISRFECGQRTYAASSPQVALAGGLGLGLAKPSGSRRVGSKLTSVVIFTLPMM